MKINLQSLFTVACMLTISMGAIAQNFGIVLVEEFNGNTIPAGWTKTEAVGSAGFTFGVTSVTSAPPSTIWEVPASVDATAFAISNDDLCNCDASADLLMSPVMNLSGFDSAVFLFDRFYDQAFNSSLGYFFISYDAGQNWLNVPLTADPAWVEDGFLIENNADLLNDGQIWTFNDQMMIGFYHDDAGAWASGVAVDNVIVAGYNNPCDDVIAIPSCDAPQNVTLGGFGTIDWRFETGCGFTTFGQEQLYTFTPTVSGVHTLDVTAATGNSWIDYMWKPVSAGCDTLGWTCFGDANGLESYGMNLTAGVPVYILADNEFIDTETQTFEISCPCTYTSLGGTPEGEVCGADLNGGCNNDPSPETYEPILCGETKSGTLWADGGNRDTDWYELVVTEATTIEVDYSGGMPINALLIDNCTDFNVLDEATSLACGAGSISYAVAPGAYILAIVPTAFEAYPCGLGGANQYDLTVTYCENTAPVDPCLTSASTYTDLNNAGGAPCNDGNGCSVIDPDFSSVPPNGIGVFGSETYLLSNVQAGFDYVFDMCTGVGAGSWIPEIAIVAPDGTTVDAWNGEAATGSSLGFIDQCSLGWTATQSGTYFIIINELGTAAGDAPNQVDCETTYAIDNGNPTVTCGPNNATCPPGPSNDECAGAIPLQVNQTCISVSGDVNFATESLVACAGTASSDVWFSFVANSSEATVDVAGSSGFDAVVQVYEASCTGASLICEDLTLQGETESAALTSLTPGLTYYIRVHDYYDLLIPPTTSFDICVYGSPVTGIVEADHMSAVVYPNPSNGEFAVEMDNVEGDVEFTVYDMAGRVILNFVRTANGTLREQLNLPTAGTYTLQLISDKSITTERLIVE